MKTARETIKWRETAAAAGRAWIISVNQRDSGLYSWSARKANRPTQRGESESMEQAKLDVIHAIDVCDDMFSD